MGRRVVKKIDDAVVEKYLWLGLTELLAVYDGAGNYKYRLNGPAMIKGIYNYYLVTDQVGTVRAVVYSNGNVAKRLDYDAFGNVLYDSAPAFTIPITFAGGLYDPDTKLIHFAYRDYDPQTGRWTAKDPLRFLGGDMNFYGYCLGDPISSTDPLGLWGMGEMGHGCRYEKYDETHPPFSFSGWPFQYTKRHFLRRPVAEGLLNDAIVRGDYQDFIDAMHMFQDTFSHYGQGWRWPWTLGHIPGNIWHWIGIGAGKPDDPYSFENQWPFLRMKEATRHYEHLWETVNGPLPPADTKVSVRPHTELRPGSQSPFSYVWYKD